MKLSSLAALEVVIWTTSSAANDENFTEMIFALQCCDEVTAIPTTANPFYGKNPDSGTTIVNDGDHSIGCAASAVKVTWLDTGPVCK